MKKVQEGNLNIQIQPKKNDDIGSLSHHFNTMVNNLREANLKIEELHNQQIEKAGHLASIGELAAGLAHEIKNPIAGIKGSLEIIIDRTNSTDPMREIFIEILAQIERIYNIVQDLLTYAKPKALHLKPAHPDACIQAALKLAESQTQNKKIRFHCSGLSKESTIFCDEDKLQEVIVNLLINSIAAIEREGKIAIDLNLQEEKEMVLTISDTGKGIKKEHLEKIFHPFFTTRAKGTGLGLSICKQLIEAHHGHLNVESIEGKGTFFTIRLPIKPQDYFHA
jgi:signal transduction histidine kinase